ncbi:hypothetical protein IAT38_008267 [Cryptococcus sp. DSM 104549]
MSPHPFAQPTPAPPSPVSPPIFKRQSYVTVSVVANDTSTSTASSSKSSGGFPVAIAIPALVGGMALAIAACGFWWWWNKRSKRQKRERWEAAQRRKKRRQADKDGKPRPSVSSSRKNSGGKSPISEKFNPVVPTLPKNAASPGPYGPGGYTPPQGAQAGYFGGAAAAGAGGYSAQQQQQGGGWQTQPGFEQAPVQYGYDQYGQPIPVGQGQGVYGAYAQEQGQGQYGQQQGQEYSYGGGYASKHGRQLSGEEAPLASNASLPATSPTSSTHTIPPPQKKKSSSSSSNSASSPTSADALADEEKAKPSKKASRATARMAVAESAAANAAVSPAFRHKPSKPSPLAIKAQQEREAAAAAAADNGGKAWAAPAGEDRGPFYSEPEEMDADYLAPAGGRANATSGEWGVALGSPDGDDTFADQQAAPYTHGDSGSVRSGSASSYREDPYLKKKAQTQSGMYSEDPYAMYHGGAAGGARDEEEDEDDGDRYHNAAESVGLGGSGKKKVTGRWV